MGGGSLPGATLPTRAFTLTVPDPDAPALRDYLGGLPHHFARFPLEERWLSAHVAKVLACNWKVFWENYNECLHCPGIHPELIDMVPVYARGIMAPSEAVTRVLDAAPVTGSGGGSSASGAIRSRITRRAKACRWRKWNAGWGRG